MRHVVFHAHLYQPPRENPWTEMIERQPSAAPLADWNERVSWECYERLGAAAEREDRGAIVSLRNLFAAMSFNVGPTLATWLARERPEVIADMARGDDAARARGGTGAAIAQAYGHPILPLCSPRERRLQLLWGVDDFRGRFGREPRGIWLPECGVDRPTLAECARLGLLYTVLAPEQIRRIRPVAGGEWREWNEAGQPTHRPLIVRLEGDARMLVWVFHGDLSRRLAFGGLLDSAEGALGAMKGALDHVPGGEGAVLVAADGETLGHHQHGAEERLARLVTMLSGEPDVEVSTLDNLTGRLEPEFEAEIVEPSAWSCAHGVGRWSHACGCVAGGRPGHWSWEWRAALREAVNGLRETAFTAFEERGAEMFREPWRAAEGYGAVLAAPPGSSHLAALLDESLHDPADAVARSRGAAALEMVRQTMFSATSCGWFFDDIAGIESVQVLRHAARACELLDELFGIDARASLEQQLGEARANAPGVATGADVFRRRALPARRSAEDALALHALARWCRVLEKSDGVHATATRYGLLLVEELEPLAELRGGGSASRVEGLARVTHLRTLAARELRFATSVDLRRHEPVVEIEGHPVERPAVPVRDALVDAAARLASFGLSRELSPRLAFFARLTRLAGDLPLPFGLSELARGAARMELGRVLRLPRGEPAVDARDLSRALRHARGTGASREELADVGPRLSRRLAQEAAWALARRDARALRSLGRALRLAAGMCGDGVLVATRREIVVRTGDAHRPETQRLAAAAGLAPSALAPADTPARIPPGPDTLEA